MDTRQIVARFEAERQALALMDHANIAKVFDAGATDSGRPYFVMELVRGTKITEFCDKNALPTRERLKLFILVCQAIQHAHLKGIIHRDIKPSNILVTLHDGVPVPKVIDFGIAKATQGELTDKTLFTQFQQFIGTPAYISPEQAETSGLDIDTRSDIYSLGVLLYELLVGQTPFDAKELMRGGLDALRQIIREKEPVKPSTRFKTLPAVELTTTAQRRQTDSLKLTHLLSGDLDWIVMKCLEKDRARRYETASGLALDIQRYLANEPVVARPPSAAYRFRKTVLRNKVMFTASTLVLLVVVFGVSAVIFVQHRANRDYRQRLYVSEIGRAGTAWQAGQSSQVLALLERCPADLRHWEWQFLYKQASRWEESVFLATTNSTAAALSADRRLLAVAAGDVIEIREFPSGQWLLNIPFQASWHSRFTISPNSDFLAAFADSDVITTWNLRTGERMATMKHGGVIHALEWSADSQRLVSAGDAGRVRIWNAKGGRNDWTISVTGTVYAVAFSPDDKMLALGTTANEAELLDLSTGVVKRTSPAKGATIRRLKFSPDGRKLAMSSYHVDDTPRDCRIWSLEDGGSLDLSLSTSAVSFDFSPDSRQLVFADPTGMIRLWDLEQRVEIERFSAQARSVRLLPDGRIFSAGKDGDVRIWQARRSGVQQLKGYPNSLRTLAFSPDGRWLVGAGLDSRVFVWNAQGDLAGVYTNHHKGAYAVAFAPDGRVATTGFERTVHVWNPAALGVAWIKSLERADDAYWLVYAPDGKRLYVASHTDTISVLDADTGRQLNTLRGFNNVLDGLAVSPDGRLLAISHKVKLSVWSADGSQKLWQAPANLERCAAFSPDGKWIATGDQDGRVSLWEVAASGSVRRSLSGHAAAVTGVSFHPDGRRLVSSSFDGQVKVWDWKAGVELLSLPLPSGGIAWHCVFSPDGKTIAAGGGDGIVTLWKTE
jgi:WD40 repeat protein